ncbi:MAG: ADP-ribosylglycohydrolase family protein [Candidatus Sumerlaeota bacterium]|nr:ADP-ribosylglycohydrolase family protein [Candidatus Sumerlaeota bacterium]
MPVSHIAPLPFAERARGCLLGFAIGDALGAPLHGLKSGRVHQVYGRVEDYVDADLAHAKKPGRWTPRGLHSAPTQLALALGDALLVGDDPAAEFRLILLRLAGDADSPYGSLRALSAPLRLALRALRDPQQTGIPEPASDPTMAVCFAALGLHHAAAEAGDLIAQAASLASLFSGDIRTIASAAAVAESVRRALLGEWNACDAAMAAVRSLADWTRDAETRLAEERPQLFGVSEMARRHAVSDMLAVVPAALREHNDDLARRSVAAEAARHEPPAPIDDPQAPFAPANVAWAVFLAVRERAFDRAVCDALAGGRETSAIAALAGAILGARLGGEAIPVEWRHGLLARAFIERRAAAYAERNPAILYEDDLALAEAEWARAESEGRRQRFAARAKDEEQREERRKAKKKPAAAPPAALIPPSTYARPGRTLVEAADPEEARRQKALRGRKWIAWKVQRREKNR